MSNDFKNKSEDDDSLSNIVYNDYDASSSSSSDDANQLSSEEKDDKGNEISNNVLDWRDKRRHFLSNSKDYLKMQIASSASWAKTTKTSVLSLIFLIFFWK